MITVLIDGTCKIFEEFKDHQIVLNNEVANNLVKILRRPEDTAVIRTADIPEVFSCLSPHRIGDEGCRFITEHCDFLGECEIYSKHPNAVRVYAGRIGPMSDRLTGIFILHAGELPHRSYPRLWTHSWISSGDMERRLLQELSNMMLSSQNDIHLEEDAAWQYDE